jgi:hypothetical protein
MSLFDALNDLDELNRLMDADPGLAANMAEMGFIKRLPFQLDHNEATVAKWGWTDYGRKEVVERLERGLHFALEKGQESKQ